MPGKSKRGKGRRPQYKNNQNRQVAAQPAPATAAASGAAAPAAVKAAPAQKTPVSTAASITQYPFFGSELKRIAIITGIILVILVILVIVLA
jgi:hypothetical protein